MPCIFYPYIEVLELTNIFIHYSRNYVIMLAKVRSYLSNANNSVEVLCDTCSQSVDSRVRVLLCSHVLCESCACQNIRICPLDYCDVQQPFRICDTPLLVSSLKQDKNAPTESVQSRSIASYGGKMDAIVEDIKHTISSHNGNADPIKCLVFSQWHDSLALLGEILELNGISTLYITGGKNDETLAKFTSDPAMQVLMLPLRSCNHGLNITEATHVFLMEPTLNPEIHEQAMARVRRLSQRNDTFVHQYVMRGTVEEAIHHFMSEKKPIAKNDIYEMFTKDELKSNECSYSKASLWSIAYGKDFSPDFL